MVLDPSQRVVVTGMGVVSPNGIGADAFAASLKAGVSGITAYHPHGAMTPLKTRAVGAVHGFDCTTAMSASEVKRVPRMVPMAVAASKEALDQAGIRLQADDVESSRQIGVALGTGGGGLAFVEDQYRAYYTESVASLYSITAGTHGNLSSELSIALGLRGPSHVMSTGCTSSTDALGYGAMLVRSGVIPRMLAGGSDSPIAPGILSAFEKMRVISTRPWDPPSLASRPFDADRDGFILGEGSWMFVLETLETARRRGAKPLAELAGYASTCDAYHRVQIAPDVAEPVRAMEMAIRQAGIEKDQIGYINVHGTSTDMNDRLETAAIRRCFGAHADRLCCSATKSMIGHPQGACGSAGVAATILGLNGGWLHPTINLQTPDPACDLDYIPNTARDASPDAALCNCIAFGSKNSAIVLKRV